jgi:hypothetical protein
MIRTAPHAKSLGIVMMLSLSSTNASITQNTGTQNFVKVISILQSCAVLMIFASNPSHRMNTTKKINLKRRADHYLTAFNQASITTESDSARWTGASARSDVKDHATFLGQ